jgi:hypothetical protein
MIDIKFSPTFSLEKPQTKAGQNTSAIYDGTHVHMTKKTTKEEDWWPPAVQPLDKGWRKHKCHLRWHACAHDLKNNKRRRLVAACSPS